MFPVRGLADGAVVVQGPQMDDCEGVRGTVDFGMQESRGGFDGGRRYILACSS